MEPNSNYCEDWGDPVGLFDWYVDTIHRATSDVTQRTDEDMGYDLFEQFELGAVSCLHDKSLLQLQNSGLIDEEMMRISQLVRRQWMEIGCGRGGEVTHEELRTSPCWLELYKLCDELAKRIDSGGPAVRCSTAYEKGFAQPTVALTFPGLPA